MKKLITILFLLQGFNPGAMAMQRIKTAHVKNGPQQAKTVAQQRNMHINQIT